MRVSRNAKSDSGGCFGASEASQRRLNGDLGMKTQEEEEEEKVVMVVLRGRGGSCWRSVVVTAVFVVLACITGSAEGQCDGSPLYLAPENSSLHVAFPEVNWDAHSGTWSPYQYYPTSVHCTWVVRSPAAHVLVAMFVQFDTEQDYDFVTIYGSEARTEQLLRVSGDLTGDWLVTSPEDTLVIDFVSDEFTTYSGFQLAYRYEPRACVDGGVTVTEAQLIALPTLNLRGVLPGPGGVDAALTPAAKSKPKNLQAEVPKGGARWQVRDGGSWVARAQYPIWVNCTWRVAVSQRQVVELEVLRFNTPERDLLKVWEVGVGGARPLLQHGGGDVPQRRSFRSSRPLLITFLAQSGEGGVGFLLDLTYITRACDPPVQVLGAPRGLVGYPHYNLLLGDGRNQQGSLGTPAWRTEERQEEQGRRDSGGAVHYGPDSCKWVIRAPAGYTLNLTVLHLDTRPQDPIKVSWVTRGQGRGWNGDCNVVFFQLGLHTKTYQRSQTHNL
ncbi:CUB and sushi domain-containing protein 3-like [Eriocheir sinensis]|uniref:CUB and sushi domain-containing protein 3-like n=1 Tax=Eriocheir sinensis TaxID=95602 RepID=UPI0021CA9F7E|nr:CUB and sushi domain-containing protein 3-like [Eriocheir sinensis]XP_050707345.1 CUB and sushi domain-containing protein 3-like [Eriocheir sinensis]